VWPPETGGAFAFCCEDAWRPACSASRMTGGIVCSNGPGDRAGARFRVRGSGRGAAGAQAESVRERHRRAGEPARRPIGGRSSRTSRRPRAGTRRGPEVPRMLAMGARWSWRGCRPRDQAQERAGAPDPPRGRGALAAFWERVWGSGRAERSLGRWRGGPDPGDELEVLEESQVHSEAGALFAPTSAEAEWSGASRSRAVGGRGRGLGRGWWPSPAGGRTGSAEGVGGALRRVVGRSVSRGLGRQRAGGSSAARAPGDHRALVGGRSLVGGSIARWVTGALVCRNGSGSSEGRAVGLLRAGRRG